MLPNEVARNERGADVCRRVVKAAVENEQGRPEKGFHYVDSYCNKPVVLSISENRKMCPDCDKQPPVGNVRPRITNAAGVVLTKKELAECGVTEDVHARQVPEPARAPKKTRAVKKAVEAKVKKVNKDELVITVSLSELETNSDIAATLIRKSSEALDSLPVTNFAESKRLIKLQERLESLVRA